MESENPPPQFCSGEQSPRHLPQEVIEEVLSRLPVKSLSRFRCVSKSWRCLIGSKRFVKTHLQNIAQNTSFSYHKVIFCDGITLKQYSLNSLLSVPPNPTTTNHVFSNAVMDSDVRIVGCCNGLICIAKEQGRRLLIWNPSTRVSNELPHHDHRAVTYINVGGFGCDESGDEFKVLVLLHSDHAKKLLKVYSSKTNVWKTLDHKDELDVGFEPGMFLSGRLHWFNLDAKIIAFDLKSEVIETIKEQPYEASRELGLRLTVSLGVLGGCLSVGYVYKNGLDVWVMKRYGVQESWVKVMTVSRLLYEACEHVRLARPLCVGPDGEILLYYGSYFAVYNRKGDVFLPLKGIEASRRSHLYIESLVSPI